MQNSRSPDERDLSFAEVDGTRTKVLSSPQAKIYNERGYYHPLTAFAGAEIEAVRTYVDHLFELLGSLGEADSYALLGYHTRCPGLYDIVMNGKILDVVEDVIGPDIICWTSQVFCKVAHDPKTIPFHQDASYWPLTPSRTVTAWLAIDDSDRENSCLQVIPGTHKRGHLKWSKEGNAMLLDRFVALDQKIDDIETYGAPADIELRAGQFSIHADLIAHGSSPNKSNRRRCGYAMRFCPPSVKPLNADWGRNAILCRGKDSTGFWIHHQRPESDDVSSWADYWLKKAREGTFQGLHKMPRGGNVGA
jgi:non-heme Fe2+,alpha-ketoglutarate-dependent halogenase